MFNQNVISRPSGFGKHADLTVYHFSVIPQIVVQSKKL